jgi:hypothetical protein
MTRELLTWEALKITPQQKAKALLASRLAAGANYLRATGQIDAERHTEILKMLAPDLKPIVNAMSRELAAKPDAQGSGQ